MKAICIEWSATTEEIEEHGLPSEVELPAEIAEDPDYQDAKPGTEAYESLYDHVSDWLSDTYEFCHEGFALE